MKVNILVRPLVFVTLTAPLLAGCGGGGSGGPGATPHSVSATLPSGLTGMLTEDRAAIRLGGTVTYTLTLTNRTPQPITYQFYAGNSNEYPPGGSVQITDAQGKIVYPIASTGSSPYPTDPVTLSPGQSATASYPINEDIYGGTPTGPFATPGLYQATATFVVLPDPVNNNNPAVSVTTGPLAVTVQ